MSPVKPYMLVRLTNGLIHMFTRDWHGNLRRSARCETPIEPSGVEVDDPVDCMECLVRRPP